MDFGIVFAIVPGIILFLYGIEQFSKEIQKAAGEKFRNLLAKVTKTPIRGLLFGTLLTALIQSSTATTVIATGLVNAGLLSFAQSLGIIFGANIGTTITAHLVSLKLTAVAPFFIIFGFLMDLFGGRFKVLGKPLFYFGIVFFSLNLVSGEVMHLKNDPAVLSLFSNFSNIFIAIAIGFFITNLFQSSSVTTGLVVVFAQSGLITLPQAIPILLGANVGTTTTTLLASARMEFYAKRAAMAHFLFNFLGMLLVLPFIPLMVLVVTFIGGSEGQQVANAHTIFNVVVAIFFLVFIRQFRALVEWIIKGKGEEIVFETSFLKESLPSDNFSSFSLIEKELKHSFEVSQKTFEEVFTNLGKESQSQDKIKKLESLSDFLDDRIGESILSLSKRSLTKNEGEKTVLLIRLSNANEQLCDLAEDISLLLKNIADRKIDFSKESIAGILDCYTLLNSSISIITENFPNIDKKMLYKMKANHRVLNQKINSLYRSLLSRMLENKAPEGSILIETLSVIDSANAKTMEIAELCLTYSKYANNEIH